MVKARASVFSDVDELDTAGFAPKSSVDASAPTPQQVRAVAEAANFLSREAGSPQQAAISNRPSRRYRTGRNVQFNAKVLKATADLIYEVSDANNWVLGYTLQRAMEALQRELANEK